MSDIGAARAAAARIKADPAWPDVLEIERYVVALADALAVPLPEGLTEIEARANAATPGPWEATPDGSLVAEPDCCGPEVGEVKRGPDDLFHVLPAWRDGRCDFSRTKANASFVAHSRTDVPHLLAGIRAQAATIRERDAEVARLDRLAKAERALRSALTNRRSPTWTPEGEASSALINEAREELLAAGGVP